MHFFMKLHSDNSSASKNQGRPKMALFGLSPSLSNPTDFISVFLLQEAKRRNVTNPMYIHFTREMMARTQEDNNAAVAAQRRLREISMDLSDAESNVEYQRRSPRRDRFQLCFAKFAHLVAQWLVFIAAIIQPFIKVFGTIQMIVYDMNEDDQCRGPDCMNAINQTGNGTYFTLVIGFIGSAVLQFIIGIHMYLDKPRLAQKNMLGPMKLFAAFTAIEIFLMAITFPAFHLPNVVAAGAVIMLLIEFLALAAVFCAPNLPDGDNNQDIEFRQYINNLQQENVETPEMSSYA